MSVVLNKKHIILEPGKPDLTLHTKSCELRRNNLWNVNADTQSTPIRLGSTTEHPQLLGSTASIHPSFGSLLYTLLVGAWCMTSSLIFYRELLLSCFTFLQ